MHFILLAPWILIVISLSWGLWLTLRKVNPPSAVTRATGLLAGIILVLIVVGLVVGVLPIQTQQPTPASVAEQSAAPLETLPVLTPTPIPTLPPTPTSDQLGSSLIEKYRFLQLCTFHDWNALSYLAHSHWETMHVVQSGETLDSIARNYDKGIYMNMLHLRYSDAWDAWQPDYDTPPALNSPDDIMLPTYYDAALKEWTHQITTTNGLTDPSNIIPGRVLIIPGVSGECGAGPGIIITPAPPIPTIPAPVIHTVRQNETLYSISRRYNVSVQAITNANRLQNTVIRVGDRLIIPSP